MFEGKVLSCWMCFFCDRLLCFSLSLDRLLSLLLELLFSKMVFQVIKFEQSRQELLYLSFPESKIPWGDREHAWALVHFALIPSEETSVRLENVSFDWLWGANPFGWQNFKDSLPYCLLSRYYTLVFVCYLWMAFHHILLITVLPFCDQSLWCWPTWYHFFRRFPSWALRRRFCGLHCSILSSLS